MGDRCLSGLGLKKDVKFGFRSPSSAGIVPSDELIRARATGTYKLVKFPSSGGMLPLIWLSPSSRITKLERLPISGGMSPPRRLRLRSKILRLASFPSSGGIDPLN